MRTSRVVPLLPLLLLLQISPSYAQNLTRADSLLVRIYRLQARGGHFYRDGLFPSKRFRGSGKDKKEDNNIFFTSLIVLTLQSTDNALSAEGKKLADTIIARALNNYPYYKNRNGDITYNFWQTNPEQYFPNDPYFSKRTRYKLPDDLDVTSIIYLTNNSSDERDSRLRQEMSLHTNLYKKRIHSTYSRYRNFKAYNTWFGKKMGLEFDICVMSNVLFYTFKNGYEPNDYDLETVALINEMVKNDDHIKHPYIISPSYQNPSIILYHLARLLAVAPYGQFYEIKDKIINDLKIRLLSASNRMEKMILLSSLYRLNQFVDAAEFIPDYDLQGNAYRDDFEKFVFFRANLLATNRLWLRKLFGRNKTFNFNFQCEAYYWALILENEYLKKEAEASR